jgi:hypothetical protein
MRISSTLFVIAGAVSLVGCDMAKANKIVGETNTIVEAANNSFKKGEDAIKAAVDKHADPAAASDAAKPCTEALDDAAKKYAQASKNLLEAAAIAGITKEFADYLKAMGESHQKSAELMELEKKPCQAFVDKSATAADDYQKALEDIEKVRQELNAIQARADKIRADNPDKFQK